jgi:hypothetical protein
MFIQAGRDVHSGKKGCSFRQRGTFFQAERNFLSGRKRLFFTSPKKKSPFCLAIIIKLHTFADANRIFVAKAFYEKNIKETNCRPKHGTAEDVASGLYAYLMLWRLSYA